MPDVMKSYVNYGGVKVLCVVRDAKVMNAKRKARQIKVQKRCSQIKVLLSYNAFFCAKSKMSALFQLVK